MCAVMHLAVVALFSSAVMVGANGTNSLRGTAEQDGDSVSEAHIPDSEAEVVDALSDILFGSDIHADEKSDTPSAMAAYENSTDPLPGLSAALARGGCGRQGWAGSVEAIAPGCLDQCRNYGICRTVGSAVGVWVRTHNKAKARRAACGNQKALNCLLWRSHRHKCKNLISRAPSYGIPLSVGQACHRRLEEVPVQDQAVQATEDASEGHENFTLDAMVAATLSSNAQGCHASTGLLRSCGARCFGQPRGGRRVGCIGQCLKGTLRKSCAGCYARRSDCTMVKCLRPCSRSATGSQCTGCVHSHCGGDCR